MKLYDVPRNTMIRILKQEDPPPCGLPSEEGELIKFWHIDGMYSYCRNSKNETVHLKAWTEVEIVK